MVRVKMEYQAFGRGLELALQSPKLTEATQASGSLVGPEYMRGLPIQQRLPLHRLLPHPEEVFRCQIT